ncbi:translation initiation factor IF-2 [bacterium]|nr:translation initiation factor IF-2 [bacterium]
MNITELARRLKITPKELKIELPKLGFHIGARAIQIPEKQAMQVMEVWQENRKKEREIKKIEDKISKAQEKESLDKENDKKKPKLVNIPSLIRVYDLAEKLELPVMKVMNELIKNGVLSSINENLDYEIAAIIAENLGFEVSKEEEGEKIISVSVKEKVKDILETENKKNMVLRPPIVVIMGHVDHGKSSILDAIRESQIVAKEKGGITQHIGAYQVTMKQSSQASETNREIPRLARDNRTPKNRAITFIDTPGHEAFEAMRVHGGSIADIAILVIAADDKIQPQTLESIRVIQKEELPFIVAINKIDKAEADPEKIKKDLSEINLLPEDWGGKIICVPVSAKSKAGLDNLLEMISLVADLEKDKLLTNPQGSLIGVVIESHLDSGLGPVATIIIYNGTLRKGDNIVVGQTYGRLKFAKDQYGEFVEEIKPSFPAQIFGLKEIPQVGDLIEVINESKEFKSQIKQMSSAHFDQGLSVDESSPASGGKIKYVNIIVRADVLGSLEAIITSLKSLVCPNVEIKIVKSGLGNLTEADVELAKTTQSWLIGFNIKVKNSVKQLIKESKIKMDLYEVIYKLIEDVQDFMKSLVGLEISEKKLGEIKILEIFRQTEKEAILGGKVLKGKISPKTIARIWRLNSDGEKEIKGESKLVQIQTNKQDVEEVVIGAECGLKLSGKIKIEKNDILEIYKEIKYLPKV